MKARALFFGVVLSIAAASPASAYSCSDEAIAFTLPLPNEPAPINARPVVRLPLRGAETECYFVACGEDVERIVVVEAPRPRRIAVAVEEPAVVTSATSGVTKTFYIAPTGVLSRDTRYELRAFVRAAQGARNVLLGTFRTGSFRDDTAPVSGVLAAPEVHLVPPPPPPLPRGTITIVTDQLPQYETYVTLFGTRATDDRASRGALMYAVWSAPEGVAIDYAMPPLGLFRPDPLFWNPTAPTLFDLGAENTCSVSSFDFPEDGRLTLGVRPVDLAGNMGTLSEIPIEIPSRTPARKRKR